MTVSPQPTPAVLAAGIAADIRTYGHYQGIAHSDFTSPGVVCVITAPSFNTAPSESPQAAAFYAAFAAAAGCEPTAGGVIDFNDNHSTAEVLEVLDRLATS